MPLITYEMRWFFEGAPPIAVQRWFAQGLPQAEPGREDRYMVLSGITDMGIKTREGWLEIKGRAADLGRHVIAPGLEGMLERWCKWSYDAAAAPSLSLSGQEAIAVGKQRVQRHFLLEPSEREMPRRDPASRGFSLELTRLRCRGAAYWTIGIEAAPDDPSLAADLLRAGRGLLQGFPNSLPLERSRSYPAWLAGLPADRGA